MGLKQSGPRASRTLELLGVSMPCSSEVAVSLALVVLVGCGPERIPIVPPADAAPPEPADAGPPPPPGCVAGALACIADAPSECTPDGRWIPRGPACAEGELCVADRGCVRDDPCARAAAEGSYIGCEYAAVTLPNAPSPHLRELFDFRVVVANVGDETAHVSIRRAGAVITEVEVAANDAAEIPLPWIEALSAGIADVGGSGTTAPDWSSLTVQAAAYRIVSDRPVVVYQFNPFHYASDREPGIPRYSYSNDASLLFPVHALGTRYVGASFAPQSMANVDERLAGGRTDHAYPGYLAVTGVGTSPVQVTVRTTAPLAAAADGRFGPVPAGGTVTFTVHPDEVVVLASQPTPRCDATRPGHVVIAPSPTGLAQDEFCLEADHDPSGTWIESTAPIAVFGGHVCAFVPYDAWACDHLESQLPPATTLGREVIVAPLVDTDPTSPRRSLVRVVGVIDGTTVRVDPPIDGVAIFALAAGEVRDLEVSAPHRLDADQGVLVTEYLVGQLDTGSPGGGTRGDPAMVLVPPTEQYRDDYVFVTPSSYDVVDPFPGNAGGQSFITVMRPVGAPIHLDGVLLEGNWQTAGGWEVATFEVDGGTHRLTGTARFGLLVFGLGTHTSYAYPGGLDLAPIFLI